MAEKKIERKYLAHYLDSTMGSETPNWYRIGKGIEELNIEASASVETTNDVIGNSETEVGGYEKTMSVDTFRTVDGDEMSTAIENIYDNDAVFDDCKTKMLTVKTWKKGTTEGTYVAYQEDVVIELTSYGGAYNAGINMPFNVHIVGNKVWGEFNPATKTFTPTAAKG